MTDQRYYELYSELTDKLSSEHELDGEIFYEIFEGKIKPIVKNVFSEYSGLFSSFSVEDICQDIFIKIWTRCVGAYFMNEKYENNAAWFLGWCKIVAKNHVTSLLRKKSLKPSETLDDPDHPVNVADDFDPSAKITAAETVRTVLGAALSSSSKAELKLTWLGVYLLIYTGDADDRIEANHVFVEKYIDGTLGDLFASVRDTMSDLPFGEELAAPLAAIGDEILRESGGAPKKDAKMSAILGDDPLGKISDWIYKVNRKLAENLPPEVLKWNT